MARRLGLCGIAILSLGVFCILESAVHVDAFQCTGMGRRYCTQAHKTSSCPKPCKKSVSADK